MAEQPPRNSWPKSIGIALVLLSVIVALGAMSGDNTLRTMLNTYVVCVFMFVGGCALIIVYRR